MLKLMAGQIVVLDEQKMLEKILELPDQLEKAWTSLWTKNLALPKDFDQVLICGMGGSGIAGALAQDLLHENPIPIGTHSDYGLPAWVSKKTLLIAVSYSGDTEETLDAVKKAIELKLPVVAITTGGTLGELAEKHRLPIVTINYQSPPRAAIGWLYGSLLTVLAKTGQFPVTEKLVLKAVAELRSAITSNALAPKAEELAMSLSNKLPLILTQAPLGSVARRFVTQLNENSKTTAFTAVLPELSHNLINGLDFAISEKISVLFLESSYAFSRNVARKKIIEKIFAHKQITFTPLAIRSESLLAEQLLFVHLGDLVSYYLAGVYGIDPSPVAEIATLKTELKKI